MKEAGAAAVPGPGRGRGLDAVAARAGGPEGDGGEIPPPPKNGRACPRPRSDAQPAGYRARPRLRGPQHRASTRPRGVPRGKTIELDRGVGTLDPQRRGDCRERWHPTAAATAAAFDAGPVEGADLAPPHPGVVELEPVLQRCRAGGQLPSHRRAVEPHRPVLTRRSPRGTPRRRPPCRGYRQHSC